MYSITVSPLLNDFNKQKEEIIDCAISFGVNYLKIKSDFKVFLTDSNDELDFEMTLACYNPINNDIYTRVNGRIIMDIIRSIFHEMVHLSDNENENIDWSKYDTIYSIPEYRANTIAGIMCKLFTKKFDCKWIYKI
jgi:hypothetical protein